jgi:plastocyanin
MKHPLQAALTHHRYLAFCLCFALVTLMPGTLLAGQLTATVTDADGKPLVDAAVYLLPKTGVTLPKARDTQIDQKNRTFVPAVTIVQTGAAVTFPNSDNIRHQVYSFSPAKTFNLKLYSGKPADPVIFDRPGSIVLGCNIHDQMVAWVLVVDTPWFARTDASGTALISDVPGGEYTLQAWHPGQRKENEQQSISIAGSVAKQLSLDAAPITSGMIHSSGSH